MTVHIPIPQVAVPDYWAGNRGRVADYLRLQGPQPAGLRARAGNRLSGGRRRHPRMTRRRREEQEL